MDLAAVLGSVIAWGCLLYGILLGGSVLLFWDMPSFFIVCGGTLGTVLVAYPLATVINGIKVVLKVHLTAPIDYVGQFKELMEMAQIARRDGILALEERIGNLKNPFLKKGMQMMVDGNPPEVISSILNTEISEMENRHNIGVGVMKAIAAYSPAMGMIGTLIGLVQMLQNLSDPGALGKSMAVALITTFYGALIANLMGTPWANKLMEHNAAEVLSRKMLLDGVLGIHSGDSPRTVADKMLCYMSPADRAKAQPEEKK